MCSWWTHRPWPLRSLGLSECRWTFLSRHSLSALRSGSESWTCQPYPSVSHYNSELRLSHQWNNVRITIIAIEHQIQFLKNPILAFIIQCTYFTWCATISQQMYDLNFYSSQLFIYLLLNRLFHVDLSGIYFYSYSTLHTYIQYVRTYILYAHTVRTYIQYVRTYSTYVHTVQCVHTYSTYIHTVRTYIQYVENMPALLSTSEEWVCGFQWQPD